MTRLLFAFVLGFGLAYLWQHRPAQAAPSVAPCGVNAGMYAPDELKLRPWPKTWRT